MANFSIDFSIYCHWQPQKIKNVEFPLEKCLQQKYFTPHKIQIKKEGKIELNWMNVQRVYKISRVKNRAEKNGQVS